MSWFGEPWPSPELRAPVCENDEDRVPTPVGQPCASCGDLICEGDQGVMIAYLPAEGEAFARPIEITCLMQDVLGSDWQRWG